MTQAAHSSEPTPSADAWKWHALETRDPACDGAFVFAVRSTGVYCRPSCPSRRPKPANVVFFDLNRQAEAAGFRPCKRCRPTEVSPTQIRVAAVERACRLIETAERQPALAELAAVAGLSPHHFHRQFKAATGLTPKAYAKALRDRRAAAALAVGGPGGVMRAVFEAGFGSAARLYDRAADRFGMAPKTLAAGGVGETIRARVAESWLGPVLVAATARGVCAVRFGDDAAGLLAGLRRTFPRAEIVDGDAAFADLVARVLVRIDRPADSTELPLDIQGTLFQQKVWAALNAIPAGETRTYAEVAAAVGQPGAARAVGNACAANPLAVLTPCHRCRRGDGGLGGYAWGTSRKARLLARETGGDRR